MASVGESFRYILERLPYAQEMMKRLNTVDPTGES
jgi:hypothetical protein